MRYKEPPIDLLPMLVMNVYQRARSKGISYSMSDHRSIVVEEAKRLEATIRSAHRFDSTSVDDIVRVIKTVQHEPLPRPGSGRARPLDRLELARRFWNSEVRP